jgi:peptidyl-prolyl cis-trans isomerase B (cyclophilin B)
VRPTTALLDRRPRRTLARPARPLAGRGGAAGRDARLLAPPADACELAREDAALDPRLDVEKVPTPVAMSPAPIRRPVPRSVLRRDGSSVIRVEVLVDTLGKPDMGTFTVLESSHGWFTTGARNAIAKWTFEPAERNGCKVPATTCSARRRRLGARRGSRSRRQAAGRRRPSVDAGPGAAPAAVDFPCTQPLPTSHPPPMKTATFETNKGTIVADLFEKDAPITVANFEKLANDGFYDGIRFHRVIPEFVVQGGCPNAKIGGTPEGPAGHRRPGLDHQVRDRRATRTSTSVGALSMAHAGKDTGGSQFFMVLSEANTRHLNGVHTVFGQITSGLDVMNSSRTRITWSRCASPDAALAAPPAPSPRHS